MGKKKALVLLSGGLDSSTTLYVAKKEGFDIVSLFLFYQQRHQVEKKFSSLIAKEAGVKEHIEFPLDFRLMGHSALTDSSIEVPKGEDPLSREGIPITYVPARNLIFLSIAVGFAEVREIQDIFIGVNALDYSGYPDCRPDFIEAFSLAATLATKIGREKGSFQIHTPLIKKTKKEIVELAYSLGVPLEKTWSCYDPQGSLEDPIPCFSCDACILREKGFQEAGIEDPWKKKR